MTDRRRFMKGCSAGALGAAFIGKGNARAAQVMKAGFSRVKITPPVGTRMTGFGFRDHDPIGSKGVHDDLYARALYLTDGREDMLVMGFDLLFFSRDEADRYKGAIGRKVDLSPRRILFNTSHTHTGPKVGTWCYTPSDRLYLQFLEDAIFQAACEAHASVREVTLWAGEARTKLPMNRRKPLPNGVIDFAPYADGVIYDYVPFALLKDSSGKPLFLLFSASCHPSTIKVGDLSYYFSADFPGVAMRHLDDYLGNTGSLFLQGAAGDSKARVIGEGEEQWRAGVWDDIEKAGKSLADDVISVINKGLKPVSPDIKAVSIEMEWPMIDLPSHADLEKIFANPQAHSESNPDGLKLWAEEKLAMLDHGYKLPASVPITAHGVKLGTGARLIGIEGEIVAELGLHIRNFYGSGVTFPIGYTDGAQLYLTTSKQIDEGGYEVESYWEYRQPARLEKGGERILETTLGLLKSQGID